jgi:hypothetical protein
LGAACAVLFLGVVFLFIGLMHEHLECDDTTCALDGRPAFSRADLRGAHTVIETGSKDSKHGVVILELAGGRERRLMQVEPDDAERASASICESVRTSARIDVTLHGPRFLVPVGVAGIAACFVLVGIALSKMGRVDLVVSADGNVLCVRRIVLGIPVASRRVLIDRVTVVVVDRGTIKPVMQQRYEGPIAAGRLRLVASDADRALTRGFYPGHALHLRAAAALRKALDLEPDEPDDAELAAIPMRTTAMGQRILFAWIGVTTGSLVGLAIFGLTLIARGMTTPRAGIEGWMLAGGMIPGAVAGAAIVFHATRARLPR